MGNPLELLGLPLLVLFVALLELGHHFFGKQFQRGHDVLMFTVAALGDEEHQVDMRCLVAPQGVPDKVGRTDKPPRRLAR